jgi:hypothetical protein
LTPETKNLTLKLVFLALIGLVVWFVAQMAIGIVMAGLAILFHLSAVTIVWWVSLLKKIAFVGILIAVFTLATRKQAQ